MLGDLLWNNLKGRVQERVDLFPGVIGLSVRDLASGASFGINDDVEFPTASTIKIHILTQLLLKAERGELDLDSTIRVSSDMYVPGSGVITYL